MLLPDVGAQSQFRTRRLGSKNFAEGGWHRGKATATSIRATAACARYRAAKKHDLMAAPKGTAATLRSVLVRNGGALTAADIHDQMFLKVQRYIEHSRASIGRGINANCRCTLVVAPAHDRPSTRTVLPMSAILPAISTSSTVASAIATRSHVASRASETACARAAGASSGSSRPAGPSRNRLARHVRKRSTRLACRTDTRVLSQVSEKRGL